MPNDMTLESLLASIEGDSMEKEASEKQTADKEAETTTSVEDGLADLLSKEASEKTSTSEEQTEMNKVASEQGKALADAIIAHLSKQAEEGSNDVIQKTERQVAEQDSQTEMTPREGKSVTETLKAIAERGSAKGAVNPDALSDNAVTGDETQGEKTPMSSDEHSVATQPTSDLSKEAHEKAAAVSTLVQQGYDFEDAVSLVKEASDEIEAEQYHQVKLAAVSSLVEEGMGFDDAVALTDQAMEVLSREAK